jgi:hypothetical protein
MFGLRSHVQNLGEALYFIGLQTPQSGREFVEVIVTSPPDHTLIERLSTGLLGRQLGRIQDRSAYYIGTAEAPVPVSANYMHHSCTFRELGPWLQVQSAEDVSLAGLEPVPTSQARSTLLAGRRLSDSVPVYTLYIYHEVSLQFSEP